MPSAERGVVKHPTSYHCVAPDMRKWLCEATTSVCDITVLLSLAEYPSVLSKGIKAALQC